MQSFKHLFCCKVFTIFSCSGTCNSMAANSSLWGCHHSLYSWSLMDFLPLPLWKVKHLLSDGHFICALDWFWKVMAWPTFCAVILIMSPLITLWSKAQLLTLSISLIPLNTKAFATNPPNLINRLWKAEDGLHLSQGCVCVYTFFLRMIQLFHV